MTTLTTIRRSSAANVAGWLALALALGAVAGAASGVGAAANETTLTVDDATVEPDENGTVRVSLDRVPEGLSGFEVTLALEEDVATVTGARYPEDYQPTTDPAIADDGRTVTLEAADLGSSVQPGATDVTLAFVSVRGSESGAAELTVTDMQVDADDGSKVEPAVEAGSVRVGSAGGDGGSNQGTADDQQGDGSSSDGSGGAPKVATALQVGAAVVVLGLVGLVVLARRE